MAKTKSAGRKAPKLQHTPSPPPTPSESSSSTSPSKSPKMGSPPPTPPPPFLFQNLNEPPPLSPKNSAEIAHDPEPFLSDSLALIVHPLFPLSPTILSPPSSPKITPASPINSVVYSSPPKTAEEPISPPKPTEKSSSPPPKSTTTPLFQAPPKINQTPPHLKTLKKSKKAKSTSNLPRRRSQRIIAGINKTQSNEDVVLEISESEEESPKEVETVPSKNPSGKISKPPQIPTETIKSPTKKPQSEIPAKTLKGFTPNKKVVIPQKIRLKRQRKRKSFGTRTFSNYLRQFL